MSTDRLASDVAVALRLLKDGRNDPDLWTTSDRQAVTRLHVWRDAEQANAQEADRQPVPGVYSADQANREAPGTSVQVEELHDRIALLEQRNGALDANAEAAKQRLARLHADHDRLLDTLTALERRLASEQRAHQDTAGTCDKLARKLADACTLEGALGTLGITRGQLDTGQAVDLCGHVYVRRDLVVTGISDASRLIDAQASEPFASADQVGAELLEARGGVFVPIPEGHMLSVTVTPYAAD